MKRLFAALLAALMLLCAVSCTAQKDPYKGYELASKEDEVFNLYIPQSWQNHSVNGVSGGVSGNYSEDGKWWSIGSGVMAHAAAFVLPAEMSPAEYVSQLITDYGKTLLGFKQLTEPKETRVGSETDEPIPALSFDYKMKWESVTEQASEVLKFRCTVVQKPGTDTVVVLSCCAPEDKFSQREEEFNNIIARFSFRDTDGQTQGEINGKDAPEGYVLASGEKYEFRFYVPEAWEPDTTGEIPGARFSASDASNVSLMSFRATTDIYDGASYWDAFQKNCPYSIEVQEVDENASLGQYSPAYSVEYLMAAEQSTFRLKQVFLSTGSMIYIFTYTSDETHFSEHMEDVEGMISHFEFK